MMLTQVRATLHLTHPASLKRGLTTAVSAAMLLTINPILSALHGPTISGTTIASVASLIAVYVLQSGLRSALELIVTPPARMR